MSPCGGGKEGGGGGGGSRQYWQCPNRSRFFPGIFPSPRQYISPNFQLYWRNDCLMIHFNLLKVHPQITWITLFFSNLDIYCVAPYTLDSWLLINLSMGSERMARLAVFLIYLSDLLYLFGQIYELGNICWPVQLWPSNMQYKNFNLKK